MGYETLITGAIGILATITSSWVSWFLARKKYNSEVDSNLIENMQQSLEFYKTLSNDNKERLEDVLKRNEALELEVATLRREMFSLMSQICLNFSCAVRQNNTTLFSGDKIKPKSSKGKDNNQKNT